ncbi:hypothetical protein Tco_1279699, partial [Tanacetum coccineum]
KTSKFRWSRLHNLLRPSYVRVDPIIIVCSEYSGLIATLILSSTVDLLAGRVLSGTTCNFLTLGLLIIPLYGDGDLTTTKFIKDEAECSSSPIVTGSCIQGCQDRDPTWDRFCLCKIEICMSTRSTSNELVSPFSNPERVVHNRQRNLGDPSLLLDFEDINMNPNNQGPPPVGPIPPPIHLIPQDHGPPGPNLQNLALDF